MYIHIDSLIICINQLWMCRLFFWTSKKDGERNMALRVHHFSCVSDAEFFCLALPRVLSPWCYLCLDQPGIPNHPNFQSKSSHFRNPFSIEAHGFGSIPTALW